MNKGRTPNFFIVGAPKCGTTTLASWLSGHDRIFMCTPKEPHYFNTDMENRNVKTLQAYLGLFEAARKQHLAIGEASTWYLYSDAAVPGIEEAFEGVRYVVMTRNPVEMAHSLYLHNVRFLQDDASSFQEAWRLQTVRRSGMNIPPNCLDPSFLQYRQVCSLGAQLKRLLGIIPRERILLVQLESLAAEPAAEYRKVLEFLGLADDGRTNFEHLNPARQPRSYFVQRLLLAAGRLRRSLGIRTGLGLLRWNEKSHTKPALPTTFRQTLEEEFAEDRALLSRLHRESR